MYQAIDTPRHMCLDLYRTEYDGKTLRENLGLARPLNRYAGR